MGMSDRPRHVVGITGFPGSGQTELAQLFAARNYALTFPRQDLQIVFSNKTGEGMLKDDAENIEVVRLNEQMLRHSGRIDGRSWRKPLPQLVETHADVRPFIQQFPVRQDIVLSDPRFVFTWQGWTNPFFRQPGVITHWCVCNRLPDQAAEEAAKRYGGDAEAWRQVHGVYASMCQPLLRDGLLVDYKQLTEEPAKLYERIRDYGLTL